VFAGDMYEYDSETEINLHNLVRSTLCKTLGDKEPEWWRNDISFEIRQKCVSRREEDEEPNDAPFSYADLIDLSKIITKNWQLFQAVLPKEFGKDRKRLEKDLRRLNRLS